MADINNTPEFDPKDIQDNKAKTIFAYISWLVLVPIFGAKESKFARFHANQGLVIAIIEAAAWLVFGLLSNIPYIGWIFGTVEYLITAGCTVLSVFGIISVAKGQAKKLPIVGDIKILK